MKVLLLCVIAFVAAVNAGFIGTDNHIGEAEIISILQHAVLPGRTIRILPQDTASEQTVRIIYEPSAADKNINIVQEADKISQEQGEVKVESETISGDSDDAVSAIGPDPGHSPDNDYILKAVVAARHASNYHK